METNDDTNHSLSLEHCSTSLERRSTDVKMWSMREATGARARRAEPLTRQRIVLEAAAIMDASGDGAALTLRAIMSRLETGSGAIYHHVSNMDELRAAAADAILRPPLESADRATDPREHLRAASAVVFDAVVNHGWLGAQLARHPLQPAVVMIWTVIGRCLQRLDVHPDVAADAGSAIVAFILGSGIAQAAGPGRLDTAAERTAQLDQIADQLTRSTTDPLVGSIAEQLRDHDDRNQFLAGLDFLIRGALSASSELPAGTGSS